MRIHVNVNIESDRFLNGLYEAIDIIDRVAQYPDNDVIIDFSGTRFVTPLFVVPLMVYKAGSTRNISFENVPDYMKIIKMDTMGLQPDCMGHHAFENNMETYARKTYIPIINFPASVERDNEKNSILSAVESIIVRQLGMAVNIATGFKYMIGESVDNIIEHSRSERGYIFAQAYPKNQYIDICIADNGITLLGSYRTLKNNTINTDIEAMQAANKGQSTKNLPEAENRGYGIITSKKMLVEGLNGSYVMMSGNALHVSNRSIGQNGRAIELPATIRWPGTIVALRIPYNNTTFQYVNYIE
ncbi:putative uncharacterized protein [Alistipes sp. CAG:157]|nr:putative uncharacterized protein [Alistipes sp. CAG:157]